LLYLALGLLLLSSIGASAATWVEVEELTDAEVEAGDSFGIRVAISGDTAVVAASSDDDGGSGAAYVYELESTLDHFLGYPIEPSKHRAEYRWKHRRRWWQAKRWQHWFRGDVVTLADPFEKGDFAIGDAVTRFIPVNMNDEGITDADNQMLGYEILRAETTPRHERMRVTVKNQFGSLPVDTIRADGLLVPKAKDGEHNPPPDPASRDVDSFKCYDIKPAPSVAGFEPIEVSLANELEDGPYVVQQPSRLCVPVDVDGQGIKNETEHLMCYLGKPVQSAPGHAEKHREPPLNKVGHGKWRRHAGDISTKELCVPSTTEVVGPVPAVASPRQLKLDAVAALDQISTTEKKIERQIKLAARGIEGSLVNKGRSLFLDDFRIVPPPGGERVFREEEGAVERLLEAVNGKHMPADVKTVFQEVIDTLVEADLGIAEHSLVIAETLVQVREGNAGKISEAQRKFESALGESNPVKAIRGFREAWETSQEVVKGRGLVVKSFGDSADPFSPGEEPNVLSATLEIQPEGQSHKDDDEDEEHHRGDSGDGRGPNGHYVLEFIEIIQGSTGAVVRTITTEHEIPSSLGNHKNGGVEVNVSSSWDGKNENGEFAPAGVYSYIAFGTLVEAGSDWRDRDHRSGRWWHRLLKHGFRGGRDRKNDEITSFPVIGTILLGNTQPTITASVDPLPNAAGWNKTNVTVSFTCAGDFIGIAACPDPVTVTTEGAGQVVSGTVVDQTGNTAETSVTLNIDKTASLIFTTVNPGPNANGWNNSNVTVGFTCTDPLSGVATCSDPVTLMTEGAGQVAQGTAVDQAGNTSTTPATVNIDKTPPLVSPTVNPPANANGWNNTDVTVSFNCTDAASGVATCNDDIVVTSEAAGQVVNGAGTDRAGNSTVASTTVSLDKTAPVVNITSPSNGANLTETTTTVTGTVTELPSGVVRVDCNGSPATLTGSTFSCDVSLVDGPNAIVVQATDVAGNTGSADISVNFSVFSNPVVTITSPASGSVINTSTVLVLGTVDVPAGVEVGVTVNGAVGLVTNGQFAALVPVDEQVVNLTVTATVASGGMGSDTIHVTVDPASAEQTLFFSPSPAIGAPPLSVEFILTSLEPISLIELDLDGDRSVDFQGTTLEGQTFNYESPGLYFPSVAVTDNVGETHAAIAIIQVLDLTTLDTILRAKWTAMKDALRIGDISVALTYVASRNRAGYQRMLNALTIPLASIDQVLTDITLVEQKESYVEYEMLRTDEGIPLSFLVDFVLDEDGIWRINFF